MNRRYRDQVSLLLRVLPEVTKENCFALHGGTAINLFIRDMPRLSVDIDLTYIPIVDRATSLQNIQDALGRIKGYVAAAIKNIKITDNISSDAAKLFFSLNRVQIKLEVNLIKRGTLFAPVIMGLCKKAQEEFDSFCEMQIVSFGELYGGKICAALDRQHPRDLFDVKLLLDNEGITEEVKIGFILFTVSGNSVMRKMINPNLHDQKDAFAHNFEGMTNESFTYSDFEETRLKLIDNLSNVLTQGDREFLLSVKGLTPKWNIYDFKQFPAVRRKLLNLEAFKKDKPEQYQETYEHLKIALKR